MFPINFGTGSSPPIAGGQPIVHIVQEIRSAASRHSTPQDLDTQFEKLSVALLDEIKNPQWSSRPRTWYILHELNRLDTMTAFICQGLNDTSLPHRRDSLPETLNADDARAFLELQELITTDILHLEKGKHVTLKSGDILFEKARQKLGDGSQGTTIVDKVTSKATSRVYARKRINRKIWFGHDKKAQKVYQNEIRALSKIENQDHLIRVVGSYTDSKYFALILEPVADMNLKDFLAKGGTPDEEGRRQLQTYFGCLAHTIRYLHGIEMLHKDIKPENVLLKSGRLILTDFGTAFDWSSTGQSMTRSNADDRRTPRYQAPEVASAGEFHRSSDIWSLGVVFLEIATVLRGRSLTEMNAFLESTGTKKTAIYENLEVALSWFEPLRASKFGLIVDNEPLAWIKKMLNRTFSTRLTAVELFDEISDSLNGLYCGGCCLNQADSDEVSESDGGSLSSITEADEMDEQKQVPIQQQPQNRSYVTSQPIDSNVSGQDCAVPGAFPLPYENISDPVEAPSLTPHHSRAPRGSSVGHHSIVSSNSIKIERPSKKRHKEPSNKVSSTHKKYGNSEAGKSFTERDTFIKWLAALPQRFRSPSRILAHTVKNRSSPSVGSQRIEHFLSTLPEEPGDFRDAEDRGRGDQTSQPASPNTTRSWTFPEDLSREAPEMCHKGLSRSLSLENMASMAFDLDDEEEEEMTRPMDMPLSKLVHNASESNLAMASCLTADELQKTLKDLKAFAASMPSKQPKQNQPPPTAETTLAIPDGKDLFSGEHEDLSIHNSSMEKFQQTNTGVKDSAVKGMNDSAVKGVNKSAVKDVNDSAVKGVRFSAASIETKQEQQNQPPLDVKTTLVTPPTKDLSSGEKKLLSNTHSSGMNEFHQTVKGVKDSSASMKIKQQQQKQPPSCLKTTLVTPPKQGLSSGEGKTSSAHSPGTNEFQKTVKDLKEYAASTKTKQQQRASPPSYVEATVATPNQVSLSSLEEKQLPTHNTIKNAPTVTNAVAGLGVGHTKKTIGDAPVKKSEHPGSSAVMGSSSEPNLGAWIDKAPKPRRKRFRSASEVRAAILDTNSTQAPTTIMSVGAREKLSHGRPLLRWNDRSYGYLPAYVQAGKVAAVREFLNAGCNPGTITKPRWAPIVKAIKGRSTNHTKCLTALVSYGVNTNASQKVSGRTPLHYAIENEPWSGYSTVIYILLAAGANPNAASRAGDKPLLMLLGGSGRLPQEKRDALLLLLAPNVDIDLNVRFLGTYDNALHLAIRMKDPFVVDAVLEKMKSNKDSSYRLLDQANGSGFTPLLLAFSVFSFTDDEAEEVHIIKLLLEYGADPSERDKGKGDTPLHRVVRDIRNPIALELLCRHSANPRVANEAGKRPLDLNPKSRSKTPSNDWFLFADRRMRNTLGADDFRPPGLIEFLDEESADRAVHSTGISAG